MGIINILTNRQKKLEKEIYIDIKDTLLMSEEEFLRLNKDEKAKWIDAYGVAKKLYQENKEKLFEGYKGTYQMFDFKSPDSFQLSGATREVKKAREEFTRAQKVGLLTNVSFNDYVLSGISNRAIWSQKINNAEQEAAIKANQAMFKHISDVAEGIGNSYGQESSKRMYEEILARREKKKKQSMAQEHTLTQNSPHQSLNEALEAIKSDKYLRPLDKIRREIELRRAYDIYDEQRAELDASELTSTAFSFHAIRPQDFPFPGTINEVFLTAKKWLINTNGCQSGALTYIFNEDLRNSMEKKFFIDYDKSKSQSETTSGYKPK